MRRIADKIVNRIRNEFFHSMVLSAIKKPPFPILLAFIICSCSSLERISIQLATPPRHPVPPEIQSLAILNRSITSNFTDLQRDSLEKILVKKELNLDTIMLDSVAADTAIQVAAKALFESDRFDVVVPKQRDVKRGDKGRLLAPLDSNFIEGIRKDFNVNAVLVLESFSEKVITDLESRRYLVGFEGAGFVNAYRATINVAYNLQWRLYQPGINPPIVRYNTKDTIFWNSFDYSLKGTYDKLPSLKETLIQGGVAAGIEMADYISPEWNNAIRRYFKTGNKEADAAIPLAKSNKWEEAAGIWNKFADTPSANLRSKVEYNLALAAEMTGNLDSAIEWATKSYKTRYSYKIESYLKQLDERRKLFQKTGKNRLSR
jgi:hypothetical protein